MHCCTRTASWAVGSAIHARAHADEQDAAAADHQFAHFAARHLVAVIVADGLAVRRLAHELLPGRDRDPPA